MKWLCVLVGVVMVPAVILSVLPRYQLIATDSALGGYILRVDRWTGRTDYWVAGSSVWRLVEVE